MLWETTTNVGIITYDKEKGGKFGINLRYPKDFEFETALERFKMKSNLKGLK